MITVRCSSSLYIYVKKNVTKSFLGFAIQSEDIQNKILYYKKNMNIDEFNLVPIKDKPFEDSDVNVMIDLDFTEKRYEI